MEWIWVFIVILLVWVFGGTFWWAITDTSFRADRRITDIVLFWSGFGPTLMLSFTFLLPILNALSNRQRQGGRTIAGPVISSSSSPPDLDEDTDFDEEILRGRIRREMQKEWDDYR